MKICLVYAVLYSVYLYVQRYWKGGFGLTVKNTTPRTKNNRHNMRMYDEDYQRLVYWAEQYNMDRTEFLITAMNHYIGWRNGDYDLPTAERQRLNQMVDVVSNLSVRQEHLEKTVINGFDAMLGIIRGDNYLIEEDDGEL